ncbi:D-Ala-D-Ala carboxypeptidase family metallohydrolase [Methylobacterium brachiatum]|uniref:D-Ala-D-Ala carboxypeptidase family metallohydrolase n=1 Tax=Methylobacterium brachiatum TaxID=269660 RepID=UPI003522F5E1|nr:D-Ala-D-Ala carboxypeptidase family metallohydrolase [Methylobacterium brachiatum]
MLEHLFDNISNDLERKVNVNSGDRDHVVKERAKKSLHLKHRAADLHVAGMTEKDVFAVLMKKRKIL